ncbi:Ca2+-binding protein, RTX toxin-related [Gemmobacter megaterium]|uniref:Ca2+-binding protein, RTX toxin-related n=1 Tax=Gemmobacter megaterium TaxID=1086013 RepID=A0A1N7PXH3_9RHOB|nr:calcium-binding protein [Gemmobacter megaterium]SIT15308.1 Ca2+-binding protein, RTX toxin-related [Gemmobacter megaterium]
MPITGLPTGPGDDLVIVTPGDQQAVNGQTGTDTLRVDYRGLSSNIDYRYVSNGWYTFTDDFISRVDHIGFERYELWFGAGDDVLQGGALADSLSGGAGNDRITSGLGTDTIDGGAGLDRWIADYGSLNSDVRVVLQASAWSTVAGTGAQVRSIEEVALTTGSGNDRVDVRNVTGNHTFNAGAGNDIFQVASGWSSFNAGVGNDRLVANFSAATSRVTQVYTSNGWNRLSDAEGTRGVDYFGVEQFWLTGGSAGDSLIGGADNDKLVGRGGNDWLNGGGGQDTIDGGAGVDTWQANFDDRTAEVKINLNKQSANLAKIKGIEAIHLHSGKGNDVITAHAGAYNDSIFGNDGNDVISTGRGKDTVNGGAGTDTLIMDWSAVEDPTAHITHRYTANGWYRYSDKSGNRTDYYGVERFNLTGGAGNDWLGGGAELDTLRGGAGDDTLSSGEGRATIDGGLGNDMWEANLSKANYAVVLDALASQTAAQMTGRSFDIRNIERVSLTLGAGNDRISTAGYDLDDWVSGGAGDDTFNLGTGHDTVNGGEGDDLLIIDYKDQTESVSSRYTSNGWNRYAVGEDRHSVDYIAIERFDVTGGSGDDSLSGGAFHDTLRGGAGDDTLNSAQGIAVIDGGTGNDRWEADLSAETRSLVFDAAASQTSAQMTRQGYSIRNIEAVNVTLGIGDDRFSTAGYALDDTVNGGDGDDQIATGLGFDVVNGGGGIDLLILDYSTLRTGISSAYTSNGWNRYGDDGGTTAVDYLGIERFNVTGGSASDHLIGGALNDTLIGGAGHDTLDGGTGGADRIVGGAGVDTWIFNLGQSNQSHHLSLNAGGDGTLSNNGTSLSGIENVRLTTGAGDDRIDLGAMTGNHVLATGAGNDWINLGRGMKHSVNGGAGNDVLVADASMADGGVKTVYVSNGWYSLRSVTGAFNLEYLGIEAFDLTGSSRADNLVGHGGNDTLRGGAGNDILGGGAGNDVLYGGAGADQFLFNPRDAGVDLIADVESGDMLRFSAANISSLTAGDGSALGQWEAQIQTVGGVTSILLGLDGTAGYDFRVDLTGAFGAHDFQIANSALTGADLVLL